MNKRALRHIFSDDPDMLSSLQKNIIVDEVKHEINKIVKGDKGDKGDKPIAGVDFPIPKDGYTPVKNVNYFDGKDGYTPIRNKDYFDGVDGENGKDGKNGSPDTPEQIIEKINTTENVIEIKTLKDFKPLTIDDVVKEIKTKKLIYTGDIKGFNMNDQRWHGGGSNTVTGLITAGTNIVITGSGTLASPYIITSNATGLVTAGTNVTITGNGTVATPFIINSTSVATTPAGSNNDIQVNYAGVFGVDSGNFIWDKTNKIFMAGTTLSTSGTVNYAYLFGSNNAITASTTTSYSLVGGLNSQTQQSVSFTWGSTIFNQGQRAAMFGGDYTVNGDYVLVSGRYHVSTAGNWAYGFMAGQGNTVNAYGESVIGFYALPGTANASFNLANRAFTIGNGGSLGSQRNAYSILFSGDSTQSGKVLTTGSNSGFEMQYDATNSNTIWNVSTDSSYNYLLSNGFVGGVVLEITTTPQVYWGGLNGGHPLTEFDVFLTSGTHYFTVGGAGGSQNFLVDSLGNTMINGTLGLRDSSTHYITFTAPLVSTAYTLTLPGAQGTAGQTLVNNGSGGLSWGSGAGTPGGANHQVQFNDAGIFGTDTNFQWFKLGNGTGNSSLLIAGNSRIENFQDGGITGFFGAHTVTGSAGSTSVEAIRGLAKQQSGTAPSTATYTGGFFIADANGGTNIAVHAAGSGSGLANWGVWSVGNMWVGTNLPSSSTGGNNLYVEGLISLIGSTSGSVTFTAPAVAGSQAYTLTTGYPASNGYVLSSTTAGVMSWVAPASGTVTGTGTTNFLPIWTSSTALGDSPISYVTGVLLLNASTSVLTQGKFFTTTGTASGIDAGFTTATKTIIGDVAAVGNSSKLTVDDSAKLVSSNITIGLATGTTTLAPLKFTAGTNLTSPVAGIMEWDGTRAYLTQTTGPTRKTIAYTTDITSTTPGGSNGNFQFNNSGAFGGDANATWNNTLKQFTYSGLAYSVSAPTGTPSGTFHYDPAAYYYTNDGFSHQIRVYAYKDTPRGRIYSSTYVQSSVITDNNTSGQTYYIQWGGWTVPAGADGVQVLDEDNFNGFFFGDIGFTLTGTTLYDGSQGAFTPDTDGWQDGGSGATTPTTLTGYAGFILGGAGFGTITPSATWDFVGDGNFSTTLGIGTNLTVGGIANVTGAVNGSSTATFTGLITGANLTLGATATITASTKLTLSTGQLILLSGTASGSSSIAAQGSLASGGTSVAFQGSTASNTNAFAAQGGTASGNGALAFMAGIASGQNAVAVGANLTSFSTYSYIVGQSSGGSSANNNYETNSFVFQMKSGSTPQLVVGTNGVGIFAHYATNAISLGGTADRIIWMERGSAANTAGKNLTLQASSATGAGCITVLNGTPTNGGTAYGLGDNFNITTGGTGGRGVVTAVSSGVVTGVQIEFGGVNYTTGTGKATSNITGSGTGLTVNISTVSTSTDLAGGNLILNSGVSTGAGTSQLLLKTPTPGSTGTSDNTLATRMTIDSTGIQLVPKITTYNNISTVSNGVPAEYATIDLTGQTAAKTTTTLYTPDATAMYRVSVYLQITTAASTSSVLGGATGVVITFTDGDGSVAQTDTVALTTTAGAIAISSAVNTTATNLAGSLVIYAKTGVAISYAIGYTSVGVTAMAYAAHLKCEKL